MYYMLDRQTDRQTGGTGRKLDLWLAPKLQTTYYVKKGFFFFFSIPRTDCLTDGLIPAVSPDQLGHGSCCE